MLRGVLRKKKSNSTVVTGGPLKRSSRVSDQDGVQTDLEHPPADLDEERLSIHDGISIVDGSGRGADFPVPLGDEIVR